MATYRKKLQLCVSDDFPSASLLFLGKTKLASTFSWSVSFQVQDKNTVLPQVSTKTKTDKITYKPVEESCLPSDGKRKYCKEMALKPEWKGPLQGTMGKEATS